MSIVFNSCNHGLQFVSGELRNSFQILLAREMARNWVKLG